MYSAAVVGVRCTNGGFLYSRGLMFCLPPYPFPQTVHRYKRPVSDPEGREVVAIHKLVNLWLADPQQPGSFQSRYR
jgi:hypothetical protein